MEEINETEELWSVGEPTLDDVLADPIVHTIMAADGVELDDLCALIGRYGDAPAED